MWGHQKKLMNNDLLINEIISKIEFKVQPSQNIRKEFLFRIKKRFFKLINQEKKFINSITSFTDIDKVDQESINKISLIDTMSKISVGFIINQISKSLGDKGIYVNIGVWRGFSMFAGMINTSCEVHGVDNFSFDYEDGNKSLNNINEEEQTRRYFHEHLDFFQNKSKHFFHDMDYKNFLDLWSKKNKYIDFYYYDGEHSYNNQYENLNIAKQFFKKGTIILIDDYNEINVQNATLDFIGKFSSSFKILKEIKTANKYIHPTYANGIILIEKI